METKTLESQSKSNTVAVSTPHELNYVDIVRSCAKRKVDNGAQFSSTKGKTSLLIACIKSAKSQLGIGDKDDNGKFIELPSEIFQNVKKAVESFWHNEAQTLVQRAILNDAHITVRHGILMSRVSDKLEITRSKTDRITSVYKPTNQEFRLCDTFGLTAAKARLDTMLDQVGKWTRAELDAQRRKIEVLEDSLSAAKPAQATE